MVYKTPKPWGLTLILTCPLRYFPMIQIHREVTRMPQIPISVQLWRGDGSENRYHYGVGASVRKTQSG